MAKITGNNLLPEKKLRSCLFKMGLRFRKNVRTLPGTPDVVFSGRKLAVFVDGCFWHKCPIHYREPKSNTKFWREKARNNMKRDKQADMELRKLGWIVLRFWEHQIKDNLRNCVNEIIQKLNINKLFKEIT